MNDHDATNMQCYLLGARSCMESRDKSCDSTSASPTPAVLVKEVSNGVDYFGGFISWPVWLLKSNDSNYIPTSV